MDERNNRVGYETIRLKAKYSLLSEGRDITLFLFEIIITGITELFTGRICKSKRWHYYIKSELIIKEKLQCIS